MTKNSLRFLKLCCKPLANGKDRPQLVVIRRHLGDGTVSLAKPAP